MICALLLSVFSFTANADFTTGKKYIGGSAWFSRDITDYDGYELGYSQIVIAPSIGYFIFDNGLAFGKLYYSKVTLDDDWYADDPDATIRISAGGKLFIQNLYGGGSIQLTNRGSDDFTGIVFEGGFLIPVTDYFYIDFGADLYWGISEDEFREVTGHIGFATFL